MNSPLDSHPRCTPIRMELISRVRREIELGIYETPEKLEYAMSRLFADVESRLEEPMGWEMSEN